MDAALGLWLLGGALVAMLMMLVVVMVARTLDRDKAAEKAALAKLLGTIQDTAGQSKTAASLSHLAGPINAMLAASQSDGKKDGETADDPKSKQAKSFFTGLAVAGGLLMLVVGVITGDN